MSTTMPANLAGRVGNIRRRDGIDLAHHLQNAGQFAALVAPVRRQQQPAFGRRLGGWGCHGVLVDWRGCDRQHKLPDNGFPGLKGYRECSGIADVKSLTIAMGMTPGIGRSSRRPGLRAGTHNHRLEWLREGRRPARPTMTAAAYGSRISARYARLSGTTKLISIRISNSRYTSAFSRQDLPEVCLSFLPQNEGAGNAGCALHPRSRVRSGIKKAAHEHTGQRRTSDIPCAMVLRLMSRSPRRIHGLCRLRRLAETGTSARSGRSTSARLDAYQFQASGPHAFAVRFGTARQHVPRTAHGVYPPCDPIPRTMPPRPPQLLSQRSVTMANAPSSGTGWRDS